MPESTADDDDSFDSERDEPAVSAAEIESPQPEIRPQSGARDDIPFQTEPPQRPLAPAPPANANTQNVYPDEQEAIDAKRRRLPRFTGVLALLVAAAGAAAYWVPAYKRWATVIAVGGLVLAAVGIVIATTRRRLGLGLPVIAMIVSVAAISVPWTIPLLNNTHSGAPGSPDRVGVQDASEQTPDEMKRRGILSVESLRLVGHGEGVASDIEYKLINKTGKPISAIAGSIRLYGKDHRLLGGLGLNIAQPIAPGAAFTGTNTWTLDDAARSAIGDGKVVAEYRTESVAFADGSQEDFSR